MRASGPGRKPGTGGKQGKRSRSMLSSSHGVDDLGLMGATSDEDDEGRDADVFEDVHGGDLSSPAKSRGLKRTGIRFDGVDDEEEEDEEDEDADFEAPEASIARAQSISASAETTDAAAAANPTEQQTTASNQANTAATATSTSTSGSKSLPDTPDNNRATATSAEASGTGNDNGSQPLDDEVEQLLLPTAALPEYIPTQCPAFPSPHSYKRTAVYPKREQDFFRNRMHKAEQSRQAEENLQRLISGPLVESSETTAAKDKESGVAMDNAGGGSESKPTQSTTASGSTNADESVEQSMNNGKQARKRIQQLFPPANFRNVDKRTRLTSFIK
ncbi:hypothetical protein GGI07_001089 [Coemansia sp. Benny D115]|nr:hypothetical protein GGI07_001089 [Coemansia sp. Benny D115]